MSESNVPSKKETLFVHCEWADEFGLKHHARVGPLRQVVSEYTEQIELLRAVLAKIKALDPYVGAGARGAGLLQSDAASEMAGAFRDAVHDIIDECFSGETGVNADGK